MNKISKLIVSTVIGALCVVSLAACSSNDTSASASSTASTSGSSTNTEVDDGLLHGIHHAEIVVQDYGTIYVELDGDTAPITVTNFVDLANSGFYDNLTFARIIEGFMIQGGDPNGDCTGTAENSIKGEFSYNGVENNISHKRGTISMARGKKYNSASCQFFICNADAESLDGQYAAFGWVTDGMDIVDAITKDCAGHTNYNGVITDKNLQPIITTINIID